MNTVNSSLHQPDGRKSEQSISAGINIYSQPRQNSCSNRTSIKMPYGFYLGGDISTGGGEPVGVDRWLAWRSSKSQANPA